MKAASGDDKASILCIHYTESHEKHLTADTRGDPEVQ